MKESAFQRKIIKKATKIGAYVINIWGNGFMKAGLPDLVICYLMIKVYPIVQKMKLMI